MKIHHITLIFVTFVHHNLAKHPCPPACNPPADIPGCDVFLTNDECLNKQRDTSILLAKCGCLWKDYIRKMVGPAKDTIFTTEGIQCFVWAMTVCEVEEEMPATTTTASSDIEVDYETGEVFGKVDEVHRNYKSAKNVVGKVFTGKELKLLEEKGLVVKKKDNWLAWHVQDDKFKLAVFGLILLFNAICVVIAVCCRCNTIKTEKEVHLSGDLDPDRFVHLKKTTINKRPPRIISIEKFLDKLRAYKKAKRTEKENRYGILEMENVGTVKQPPCSSMSSRGTYQESADEQSDLLDTTYEEPMPSAREVHPMQLRKDGVSDEDTLYENLRPRDNNRSVSFKIPPDLSKEEVERVGFDKKK